MSEVFDAHHWVGKGKQLWRFSDGSDLQGGHGCEAISKEKQMR
jgi:hypothetical protein